MALREAAPADPTDAGVAPSSAAPIAWVLAGVNAAAAVIHFAMVPEHIGGGALDPVGFAVAGWCQLAIAVALVTRRAGPAVHAAAVAVNAALIGFWVWSRTSGLPFGSHEGIAEEANLVDLTAVGLEAAAVAGALLVLLAPGGLRLPSVASMAAGVGALGLATVAITGSDAGSHGDAGEETVVAAAGASASGSASGGDGHAHGGSGGTAATDDGHATEMVRLDRARCDLGFNPQSYWDETAATGVDTYAGGAMSATDHGGTPLDDVAEAAPFGGRGNADLDQLLSLTSQADAEIKAAQLVVELSEADDEVYGAWQRWMRANGGGGHHDEATPDSDTHMGHAGPQPWSAMVDPSECRTLTEELDLARETALRYPTAQDALDNGWIRVTPYVPGIAAHYMNFTHVDGEFDIEEPEMLLYDGNGTDAKMVGLSYYIRLDGTTAPTQGFSGVNDSYHRHLGLCVGAGGVIGDSTTTDEDCKARGGVKASGTDGWMAHAWVVPGCESPWGVFSGVNPILDEDLGQSSGKNDGGCSASSVLDRYDLEPGRSDLPSDEPLTGVASGG